MSPNNTLNVGGPCITSTRVVPVIYYFGKTVLVIIHMHQSVPETKYICFMPNTIRSPAHISVDGSNKYKFMNPQNIPIPLF